MSLRTVGFKVLASAALCWGAPSMASDIDPARMEFANAVHEAAPDWVHNRRPQALLRAVVVLNIKLDADNHWRADVVRTNSEQPEMLTRALETVLRARVGALPDHLRDKLSKEGFMETWLFDNDGTFQVKTLAKAQMNE